MTRQQTRQLGIEFERRLYEIYPEFKGNQKLTTDVIYSILSEYQNKYVTEIFTAMSQAERGTGVSKVLHDSIKTLVRHKIIAVDYKNIDSDKFTSVFAVPEDYYLYIRSNSIINKNYKKESKLATSVSTPNLDIKHEDVKHVLNTFYNDGAIVRNPLVVLESLSNTSPYIKVIHDKYTNITSLDLTYCYFPHSFNVLKFNDNDTSKGAVYSYCELPFECFDNLVTGAIDLYIQNYKFKLSGNKQTNKEDKK